MNIESACIAGKRSRLSQAPSRAVPASPYTVPKEIQDRHLYKCGVMCCSEWQNRVSMLEQLYLGCSQLSSGVDHYASPHNTTHDLKTCKTLLQLQVQPSIQELVGIGVVRVTRWKEHHAVLLQQETTCDRLCASKSTQQCTLQQQQWLWKP